VPDLVMSLTVAMIAGITRQVRRKRNCSVHEGTPTLMFRSDQEVGDDQEMRTWGSTIFTHGPDASLCYRNKLHLGSSKVSFSYKAERAERSHQKLHPRLKRNRFCGYSLLIWSTKEPRRLRCRSGDGSTCVSKVARSIWKPCKPFLVR
jgi:hypothetical protein